MQARRHLSLLFIWHALVPLCVLLQRKQRFILLIMVFKLGLYCFIWNSIFVNFYSGSVKICSYFLSVGQVKKHHELNGLWLGVSPQDELKVWNVCIMVMNPKKKTKRAATIHKFLMLFVGFVPSNQCWWYWLS